MVATSVPGVTRRSTAPSMLLRSDDLEGEWLSHTLDAIEVQCAFPSLEEEWLSATLLAMPQPSALPVVSMEGAARRRTSVAPVHAPAIGGPRGRVALAHARGDGGAGRLPFARGGVAVCHAAGDACYFDAGRGTKVRRPVHAPAIGGPR